MILTDNLACHNYDLVSSFWPFMQ